MKYALLGLLVAWLFYQAGQKKGEPSVSDEMTPEKAREVLGVDEGASQEEVQAAYQQLIKKIHPDAGGSEYLTKVAIQAKKVLDNA